MSSRTRLRVVARVAGQPDLLTAVPEHQIGAGKSYVRRLAVLISDFEYADTQPGRLGGCQSDGELYGLPRNETYQRRTNGPKQLASGQVRPAEYSRFHVTCAAAATVSPAAEVTEIGQRAMSPVRSVGPVLAKSWAQIDFRVPTFHR
jgi:hypothetical protein